MLTLIKSWKGPVEVNGTLYDSVNAVNLADIKTLGEINIKSYYIPKKSKIGAIQAKIELLTKQSIKSLLRST